jgi:hypothetical protein
MAVNAHSTLLYWGKITYSENNCDLNSSMNFKTVKMYLLSLWDCSRFQSALRTCDCVCVWIKKL